MKCSYCENNLTDGMHYCLHCGRKNEKALDSGEVKEQLAREQKRVRNRQLYFVAGLVVVLLTSSVGFSYLFLKEESEGISSAYMTLQRETFEQYQETETALALSMAKRKINQEIKELSGDYKAKQVYDSDFYERLSDILEFDEDYEMLEKDTKNALPAAEYAFSEMSYDRNAEKVGRYLDNLAEDSGEYQQIREAVQQIYDSYVTYAEIETAYANKEYAEVMTLCGQLEIYEGDTSLKENIDRLLAEVGDLYGDDIAMQLQDAFDAEAYTSMFAMLDTLREVDESKYEAYSQEYLTQCVVRLEELTEYGSYEEAFALARLLYEQSGGDYVASLLQCYEYYADYLINEADDEETAEELTAELAADFPNEQAVERFQKYFDLEDWKKEYRKILGTLSEDTLFTLYTPEENEIPFLITLENDVLYLYSFENDTIQKEYLHFWGNQILGCENNRYVVYTEEWPSRNVEYNVYTEYAVNGAGEFEQLHQLKIEQRSNTYLLDGSTVSEEKYQEYFGGLPMEWKDFFENTKENIENLIVNQE